jgi:hypothetical protein
MPGTSISFDGNSLQTANILAQNIAHEGLPMKDAKIFALSNANRSTIPYVQYPNKSIRVSGQINGSSIADLDARIDAMKAFLLGTDKNLDIDYSGTTRRYIATVNATSFERPGGLLFANWVIDFICTQPFGQNTATTSALNQSGRTASSYSDVHVFLGSAPFQLPVITITFSVLTGGTAQTLFFGNNGNGQGISVTRTWLSTDVLVIDCVNKTVTVNGSPVAFTGAFPEFPPGSQTLGYSDTFTTRTFAITVNYYPMFL